MMHRLRDPEPSRSVGVIVPPSNPTVEYELRQLLGDSLCLYTTRLPYCPEYDLEGRNKIYLESYENTARRFGDLRMQGILIACTGPQYQLGLDGDRRLCEELSEQIGTETITVSLAIYQNLVAAGVKALHLELPYPDWLREKCRVFWESAGFRVLEVCDLLQTLQVTSAYEVRTKDFQEVLARRKPSEFPDAAMLVSGTGMVSIEAILTAGNQLGMPILSSNLCAARWLIGRCEGCRGSALYNELMKKQGSC